MKVTKQFTFDAAHSLTDYKGKCARLHGHTYKLEVTYEGKPTDGIVRDFSDIKSIIEERILSRLDHTNLNEVLPFRTTAENIALWILQESEAYAVRLWETPTSYVEVDKDDL